ncbi:Uncharacterised protein [Mycobacteroides abscessus subsp. abscessus]|uniref:HNH endonuclease n=1 Tax=Mycobacteroides abscessus TaxID=36809 RepID=UPI00092A1966|nr:HNH endonuclease [Mycobacteroides abscessus]SIE28360.1 Uncharacterised protein [Mycobacteroides abscessus subsp. abscessus]SKV14560.1 Uncharacterised protein [Mycobacteroides abscessus subsp. abscessus]
MSLSVGELKKVSVASIRDIAAGLRAKSTSMRATKAGVTDLPHKGSWTGVAADNADHEIGHFAQGVGRDADAYEDAAKKADRAGDEFEGIKQLLAKLENEASGKFSINEATGEVTPLSKDFNKSDRDYIANTIKQLCAAGGQANDDLAAAIHATDASGATSPASAPTGPLAPMPGSAVKPDGVAGGLQNLAGPNPDGDPGATKAAAAVGGDTQANYKEWYPKNGAPAADKSVDPSKLGSVGALPGVGNIDKATPAKLAPTLADRDVPAFKEITRQNLINARVPADQIEQRVNDAVKAAQTPHFAPEGGPMRTPGEVPLHNSPGDQFNKFVSGVNESATKTIDGQIDQAKVLTGQAGPGAPGVAEAWKDHALAAGKQIADPLAIPKMAIQDAQHLYHDPADFIGQKTIEGTEALGSAAVGGEGAIGARGALGDLAHGVGDATPGHHPMPPGDHHAPSADHTPTADHDHSPIDASIPSIEHPHNDIGGGSTYKERLDQTPINNGQWEGERGESKWISHNPEVNQHLNDAGVDGIHYGNARPDFSPVTKGEVEIPNMTTNREWNFKVSDKLLADQWGVSPQDVLNWRKENGYSWHEEPDMKTMQLVPTIVNGRLGHIGGIGELNRGAVPPIGEVGP